MYSAGPKQKLGELNALCYSAGQQLSSNELERVLS